MACTEELGGLFISAGGQPGTLSCEQSTSHSSGISSVASQCNKCSSLEKSRFTCRLSESPSVRGKSIATFSGQNCSIRLLLACKVSFPSSKSLIVISPISHKGKSMSVHSFIGVCSSNMLQESITFWFVSAHKELDGAGSRSFCRSKS